MTASQRSSYTKRRKVIWEALHPVANQRFERVWDALPIEAKAQRVADLDDEIQVAQLAPPVIGYGQPPPQTKAFAAETAAITGESKSQVNRHLARAEALGDDLERTVGTLPQKGENPHRSRACAHSKGVLKVRVPLKPAAPLAVNHRLRARTHRKREIA